MPFFQLFPEKLSIRCFYLPYPRWHPSVFHSVLQRSSSWLAFSSTLLVFCPTPVWFYTNPTPSAHIRMGRAMLRVLWVLGDDQQSPTRSPALHGVDLFMGLCCSLGRMVAISFSVIRVISSLSVRRATSFMAVTPDTLCWTPGELRSGIVAGRLIPC